MSVVDGEEGEEERAVGERESSGREKARGGSREGEGRKASCDFTKIPLPSLFLFVSSYLITSTASLVRIPNSKPESLIRPSIDYSFPNI